jgi:predicted metal-dependent hydrolase
MAFKIIEIENLGRVRCYKLRNAKAMRISINHSGEVRLSLPVWVPYREGVKFLLAKQDWIKQKLNGNNQTLNHGMRIGKAHQLAFAACSAVKIQTKIVGNTVNVNYPEHMDELTEFVQTAAKTAALRVLRREAELLLPQRLHILASQSGLTYKKLNFKLLKRRWGSCSPDGTITLNVFLMQLPWHLIDYVLIHELTHTKVMSHGKPFWDELQTVLPGAKDLRRQIRAYQPAFNQLTHMS